MDDQVNIRLIAIENYSHDKAEELKRVQAKVLINRDDIYALKLWKNEVIARLDQGIENRTKAFERIELLEKQVSMLKNLLDQYFTLEINQIKESHAKRKV